MTLQVLLIENNDLRQAESLLPQLEHQGYDVALVDSVERAVEKTAVLWPNLIIFSPYNNQLQLSGLQEIISKTKLNIPCIVVSKENHLKLDNTDLVVVEPDQPQQLRHEIKEITNDQKNRFIRLPELIIDCQEYQVLRHKERHPLTPKEFKLLHLLITHQQEVISRKAIMQAVWETDYMGDTRTLDVHIRWLREKIEENPSQPKRLITVRGVGKTGIRSEFSL